MILIVSGWGRLLPGKIEPVHPHTSKHKWTLLIIWLGVSTRRLRRSFSIGSWI